MPDSKDAAPILSRSELITRVAAERSHGRTIALANGCFDVLHAGHIRYLQGASELAEVLVVGVNSDAQVTKLKGAGRPVIPESERAEMIAAIEGVHLVTVFPEATVEELLLAIKPDFHAKGTDYTEDTVPEREVVRSFGGKVVIVGDPKDHSSSDVIEKIGNSNQSR